MMYSACDFYHFLEKLPTTLLVAMHFLVQVPVLRGYPSIPVQKQRQSSQQREQ